jgi:hypothetical protein
MIVALNMADDLGLDVDAATVEKSGAYIQRGNFDRDGSGSVLDPLPITRPTRMPMDGDVAARHPALLPPE